MGICYSESNMLGAGMGETYKDGGLSDFGYDVVKRMNKLGMLIDVGHTTDRTAIETIEASDKPVFNSHSGPGAIADGHTNSDEVLHAFAENDGLIGVGGAGNNATDGNGTAGTVNRGGGGGGAGGVTGTASYGGAGGSGIVIIRYTIA